jgi:hypothetical protein
VGPALIVPLVAGLVTAATPFLGWIALPLAGTFAGIVAAPRVALFPAAGAGGGLAWLALLGWNYLAGEAARLDAAASAVLGLPPYAFVGLTVVFAFLVTAASAVAAAYLRWCLRRGVPRDSSALAKR